MRIGFCKNCEDPNAKTPGRQAGFTKKKQKKKQLLMKSCKITRKRKAKQSTTKSKIQTCKDTRNKKTGRYHRKIWERAQVNNTGLTDKDNREHTDYIYTHKCWLINRTQVNTEKREGIHTKGGNEKKKKTPDTWGRNCIINLNERNHRNTWKCLLNQESVSIMLNQNKSIICSLMPR